MQRRDATQPSPPPRDSAPPSRAEAARDSGEIQTQPQLAIPPARPDTVDVELEMFADEDSIEPPGPSAPSLDPEARAVIATCEGELETGPQPLRAARLHHEIARAYDTSGFAAEAATHYQQALEGAPDYLPAIRGARRARIDAGDFEGALALFDAEEKLTPTPRRKAMLLHQKGRMLEDRIGDTSRAREVYLRAAELDPSSSTLLKALEQCDRRADAAPGALLETLERVANAITDDPRHRAAVMVERARLQERGGTGPAAAELYEAALRLDPHAFGALDALERIYRRDHQWRGLITALERAARQTNDQALRALALQRLARIHDERLNNRAEAVAALVKAADAAPADRLVLEDLARGHERAETFDGLAAVLASLVALAADTNERVSLLHRLGQVYEGPLQRPEEAIERYREALGIEPTCTRVLDALGPLLAARNQWAELVEIHFAEANATQINARAAAAHARVAEIFEVHLRDPAKAASHHARVLTLVPGHTISFKALVRLYAQLDRHRELVELLERAIEQAALPSLKIAYLFKVGAIWEDTLGDPLQGLHAFRRVLDLEPSNLVAIHSVQRVAERAERYQQLVEALEHEVELVSDRALQVGLLHHAGTVLDEHLRDPDGALQRLRGALELDPSFLPALTGIGRIYQRTGRWADLLDIYSRQVNVTPPGPEAVALLHEMGELCERKLADVQASSGWHRKAVELDPTYRPSLRALARQLQDRGEWAELARILELELTKLEDPATRAVVSYRIGQVHEEWLGDTKAAIAAYERAVASLPGYRPAISGLVRLFAEQREWMQLIDTLAREHANTRDEIHGASTVMRQGEIYRDELDDAGLAVLCFEAVAEQDASATAALLALEALYGRSGSWDKLANAYSALGRKLADPGARIASLRELARLQETRMPGSLRARAETYEAILAIEHDDETALLALEQIGRARNDDRTLASVYTRLSAIAESAGLAASFFTDLGRSLERSGDRHALEAYRAAVKKDASVLTAIRGLARVGDLRGDARAMAHAARLEAELTRKPEIAAKLFVRAGILRREQMNDLGAVEDFERALDVWPDDQQAAERIIQPLLETGQVLRLIDILSKTAQAAKSNERRTALWLEIGSLYTRRFDNLGAAISAFKRALDATPGHVATLSKLAEAHERNRSWGDSVATLEQLLVLTSDEATRAEAHLKLAAIFDEHLNNIARASRCVEAVLRHDPSHSGALLRLADIQLRGGNEGDAVKTTQRLVDLADSPGTKGAALVRVARIQRSRGETAAAENALSEALALEGPGGDAERELKKSIEGHGNRAGYAAGLANHIKRVKEHGDPAAIASLGGAYLELETAYSDMKLGNRAIDALIEGLTLTNDDERLVLALVKRLREAGRLEEALGYLKRAVSREPIQIESWRELGVMYGLCGRSDDEIRVAGTLAMLGESNGRRVAARPASAADGSFDHAVVSTIAVDAAHASPAAILLASIADCIGKIYPPSLERHGLSQRDRVGPKSGNPLWDLAVRVGKIFGAEFELYEHTGTEPMIAIEPFEMPALIVSQSLRRLPVAQQVFLLSYGLGPIAGRLHAALALRTPELEVALIGAARVFLPSFTLPGASLPDEVEDAKEILRKTLVRKWRKAAELASGELSANPPADIARWQSAINQTAMRAALLVADDLPASIEALRHITELPDARGAALVQSSTVVRDMMRFWISNRAASVRLHTGIVPS